MTELRRLKLIPLMLLAAVAVAVVASYRNTISPDGIVIHHSAMPWPGEAQAGLRLMDEAHKRRAFGAYFWGRTYYIGYHYIVLPDGAVLPGRPERCRGAHAAGFNSSIGICLVGDFETTDDQGGVRGPSVPTPSQMQALIDLTRRLRQSHGITPENIRPHRSVSAGTDCPGDRFPFEYFLRQVVAEADAAVSARR